ETGAEIFSDREPGRIDVPPASGLREQPSKLGLSLALGALERSIRSAAPAAVAGGVKFQFPCLFASPADVSSHDTSPGRRSVARCSIMRCASVFIFFGS